MDALQDLNQNIRFDVIKIEEQQLREAIKQFYFADQLQLPSGGPQMTAFETQVRFELMQRLLGPTFGRLVIELLNPIIDRTFGILSRNSMLPDPPEILEGRELDVEFEGPLARAQRSGDITAMQRWTEVMTPFLQANPELLDVVKDDDWARHAAHIVGVPPNLMRSEEEIAEKREARQQAEQAAAQQEQMGGAAEAIGKAGPGIKALQESGVIDQLSEQVAGA